MHVFRFSLILSLSLSLSRAHHQLMKSLRARTRTQMDTDLKQVVDVLKEYHDNLGAEGNGNPRTHTLAAVARAPSLFLQRSHVRTHTISHSHALSHARILLETNGRRNRRRDVEHERDHGRSRRNSAGFGCQILSVLFLNPLHVRTHELCRARIPCHTRVM
jgi:hypothetical protein